MLRSHGIACDSKSGIGSYTIRQVPVVEQCLVFCLLWKLYVIDCFSNRRNLSGVFSRGLALSKQKAGPDPFQTDSRFPRWLRAVFPLENSDFTNCWLTDIVISRPTNQPHNLFHDALSSEKKKIAVV
jgi:hypothetical protein